MKKRMLLMSFAAIIVVAVVVIVVSTGALGGNEVSGDTYETRVGKTFTIALDANPTTGYSWTQNVANPAIVAYVSDVYAAEQRDPQVVGGGGTTTFTFKAVAQGTTTIKLVYARSWESVPAAQERTITVTVK